MRESSRRWPSIVLTAIVASALTACNGSAGSPSGMNAAANMVPQSGSTSAVAVPDAVAGKVGPVNIYPGEVVGIDNRFVPPDGDTKTGGQGQKVGAVTCDPVEHVDNYHIHYYVGLIVDGRQIAIPDAIGMMNPGLEQNGYISSAKCYYWIHTHDASGMMHIEDPRNLPPSAQVFKFGEAMQIWGVTASATNFGHYNGPVHVFVGNVPLKQTTVSKYAAFTKGLAEVPLRSHTAIWIEVGAKYRTAAQLPPVTFYTEY